MKKHLNSFRYLVVLSIFWFSCSSASDQLEETIGDTVDIQSFSELLEFATTNPDSLELQEQLENALDSKSFPLIESDTNVYFIYQGSASNVAIAGDFNRWNPSGYDFTKLERTNIWYRKAIFESNARLDYKVVVNGSNWILDPKNPNRIPGGFGYNSELSMPEYQQPIEIQPREGVNEGSLETIEIPSQNTGKTYTIKVYLPTGYSSNKTYPVAYFQDGNDYLNLASTTVVIDNLIHDGAIKSMIGVFVVPTNRNVEYAFDDRFKYKDFFVSELVPTIDERYSTITNAADRAVIGDSYGGNISAIIAFSHPEIFGNCGIHSGAFQANNFNTNSIVMDGVKKDIKVASIWGTYEGASLPNNMTNVKDYLVENNYDIFWKELPDGHSWGLWRATTDDMLTFFFPAD